MGKLAVIDTSTGELTAFNPEAVKNRNAKLDAVADYAKRMKDWPLLEQAVEQKIEDQAEFVAWWNENITKNHGGDRKSKSSRPNGRLDFEAAEKLTGFTNEQVSKWKKKLANRDKYRALLYGAAYRKAMGDVTGHRTDYAGENEWYTPKKYIESAREVMGGIDLDPASSEAAQVTVNAATYYTAADDGLKRDWEGRVWLNPPYAQPLIHHFIEKLIAEANAGRVTQAIVVTHNSTDTLWFHRLEELASAICFTRGRIAFIDPQGDRASPPQGQSFFYVGDDRDKFSEVFLPYGFIR